MSVTIKPYTFADLVHAVYEYKYAAEALKGHQDTLNAKRAAIKSFEDAAAAAATEVARHEDKVLRISKALK